jgi:resuscitation-promoting factor RpfB
MARPRVSGRFIGSAVAAGVVMAAVTGHHAAAVPGGSQHASVTSQVVSGPANEQLANQMAASGYRWTGGQTTCLDRLWTRESAGTWSPTVVDPLSGAYGIPQSLPPDKMAAAGPDWQTDPATQIRWGLGYIRAAYGTPCTAWDHETADGWY